MIDKKKLEKLRDKYQKKADYYWENYQIDGFTSALRSYERNNDMAEAIDAAINAADTESQLSMLKIEVMALKPDDERGDLALAVKRLQNRVSEGKLW